MEKKQSSIDWLEKQLNLVREKGDDLIWQYAKQMEKEQRFQDFKEGFQAALESLQGANNLVQSKKFGGDNE